MSDLTTVTLVGTEDEAVDTAALKAAVTAASSSETTIFKIDGFMAIREAITVNKPIHFVANTRESGFIMGSKHSGAYPSMTDTAVFYMGNAGNQMTESDSLVKTPGPTEGAIYLDVTNAFASTLLVRDWVCISSKTPLSGLTPHTTNQYPAEVHQVTSVGAADSGGSGYARIYISTPLLDAHTTAPRISLLTSYRTLKDIYWEGLIFQVATTRYTGATSGTGSRSVDTRGVLRPRLLGLTICQQGGGEVLINSPLAIAEIQFKYQRFGDGELVWNYGVSCHGAAADFDVRLRADSPTGASTANNYHHWTTGAIGFQFGGNRYGTPNGVLRYKGQVYANSAPIDSHPEGKYIYVEADAQVGATASYFNTVFSRSRCRNLFFRNSSVRGGASSMVFFRILADGCGVENSHVIGGYYGVEIGTWGSRSRIHNVTFENVASPGFTIGASAVANDVDIHSCNFINCGRVSTSAPFSKSPVIIKAGSSIRIRNCNISKASNPSADQAIDIYTTAASSIDIDSCNMDGYTGDPIIGSGGSGNAAELLARTKYWNTDHPIRTDVTFGADDSAGAGYRTVRVPNEV